VCWRQSIPHGWSRDSLALQVAVAGAEAEQRVAFDGLFGVVAKRVSVTERTGRW